MKDQEICFKENCFTLLRYFAALCVMVGHFTWQYSNIVTGSLPTLANMLQKITNFIPGVVVFFTITGFLVAASADRSESIKFFLKKRVLRLYPELWICTIFNAAIMIIVNYSVLDKSFIIWILSQFFGLAYTPECLTGYATGSINGSLWTIFTTIQFYIVIGLFNKILQKLKKNSGYYYSGCLQQLMFW